MTCQFCSRSFNNVGNLQQHMRTAKYCLKLQGKTSENCEMCGKELSARSLANHQDVCMGKSLVQRKIKWEEEKVELQQELQSRDKQIAILEAQLKERDKQMESMNKQLQTHHTSLVEIAKQRAIKTKNIINNHHIYAPLDMSQQSVSAILEQHLTPEVIGDGQRGLAQMLHAKMLTDGQGKALYECTDKNRHHFKFLNTNGHVEHDPKASKLKKAMVDAKVGPRAIDKIMNAFQEDESRMNAYLPKAIEINALGHNDAKFRQHLACLTVNDEGNDKDEDEDEDMDEDMDEDDIENVENVEDI